MEIVALLNSGLTMSNGFDSAKAPERLMKAQAQELLQILQRDLAAYDSMLPSLPEVAVRVRTLTADPECTIQQLEQEIAKDAVMAARDRKSTRLNSSHVATSYAVFCVK